MKDGDGDHGVYLIAKIDETLNNSPSVLMGKNLVARLNRLRSKATQLSERIKRGKAGRHVRDISLDRVHCQVNQLVAHLKDIARKYKHVSYLQDLVRLEERALASEVKYQKILSKYDDYRLLLEQVRKNPTVPDAAFKLTQIERQLEQIVSAHHQKITRLETTYRDLLLDPAYANLHRWIESVRQNVASSPEMLALLQIRLENADQVRCGKYPRTTSYEQAQRKFAKHIHQIKRTARELGFEVGPGSQVKDSAELQQKVRGFIDYVVANGMTRQIPYKPPIYPTALWSRLGNAIVIRQADGTFITFLEAGKGYAKLWVE